MNKPSFDQNVNHFSLWIIANLIILSFNTLMNLDIMLKQRIPTILDNLSECSPVNVFSPGLLNPSL